VEEGAPRVLLAKDDSSIEIARGGFDHFA
jgi:hypothetical protein